MKRRVMGKSGVLTIAVINQGGCPMRGADFYIDINGVSAFHKHIDCGGSGTDLLSAKIGDIIKLVASVLRQSDIAWMNVDGGSVIFTDSLESYSFVIEGNCTVEFGTTN